MAKIVAVYSVTGGTRALIEADGLVSALRQASSSVGEVHVVLCGCGSRQAAQLLLGEPAGADVRLETFGLLRPERMSRKLSAADGLFVRPQKHFKQARKRGRRNRLWMPIVCYSGPETAWPITEAGIPADPFGKREALAAALETVLSNGMYRRSPAERRAEKLFFMALNCGTVSCGAKVAQ